MISFVRIFFVLCACLALSTVASALPIVAAGEQFSGSLSIDPLAPCSTCNGSGSPVYETFSNAGSISIDLAGTNFSGNSLYIEVSYDDTPSGPLGQWSGSTTTANGGIQILLDGTSRSTSILPLALSQYQPLPPLDQVLFSAADGNGAVYSYAGSFTSLTPLDQPGNFAFEGTITQFEVLASAVPEVSTWAMMILGALGIGLLAHRPQDRMTPKAA